MTLEIISIIIQLCTIRPSGNAWDNNAESVALNQLNCQKYYINCVERYYKNLTSSNALARCIKDKSL